MKPHPIWTPGQALQEFRQRALDAPDDFLERFDWAPEDSTPGHDLSEVDAIYAEVISKIPAGVTKVLEIGCGDGRFYRALKAARPSLEYRGIDLVAENITEAETATATVTVVGVQSGDTVTINGVVLTASGSQTAGGLDFREDIPPYRKTTDQRTAESLIAAVNDAGNGLSGDVVASGNGTNVVTLRHTSTGTAGNAITLASSDAGRLAVSGSTLEGGLDSPSVFEVGNAIEFLAEEPADWDFIVSINCAMSCTPSKFNHLLFDYIDSKASKGFFILADKRHSSASFLASKMVPAIAASANVTGSYHEGTRDFLDDVLLKGILVPYYIHRDSTTVVAPSDLPPRAAALIRTDHFMRVIARQDVSRAYRKGQAAPSSVPGVTKSGGRASGRAMVSVDPEWTTDLRPRPVEPATPTAE